VIAECHPVELLGFIVEKKSKTASRRVNPGQENGR
jgi:hypothetical protein